MSKKNIHFYKLPIEIAASKELTHSEKIIAAYLFTLFGNGLTFYGSNALLSAKLGVQKSVISPCLTKFELLGWITITNRKGNKRSIRVGNNPISGSGFYRLYYCIAATNKLTALEKILISYILSFIDNGKRFYAKNAMVAQTLDISKEGFNTSRIKFEELNWIQVKYPKTPRRELVVINHPTDNLTSEFEGEPSENGLVNIPNYNVMLPENNGMLPLNNDNNISNKISDKRIEIREDIKEVVTGDSNSSFINSFVFNSEEKTSSTREASPEATTSIFNQDTDRKPSSTKNEAHASLKHYEETSSTRQEAHASYPLGGTPLSTKEATGVQIVNKLGQIPTSSFSGTPDDNNLDWVDEALTEDKKPFDVNTYLSVASFIRLQSYIVDLMKDKPNLKMTMTNARNTILSLTKEQIDELMGRL